MLRIITPACGQPHGLHMGMLELSQISQVVFDLGKHA